MRIPIHDIFITNFLILALYNTQESNIYYNYVIIKKSYIFNTLITNQLEEENKNTCVMEMNGTLKIYL